MIQELGGAPEPGQNLVTDPTPGFDPALAQAFGFDPVDLQYNQRWVLSPKQIAALRAEHTGMVGQSHLAAIVMGVFYVCVTIAVVIGAVREEGTEMALKVGGLFVGIGVLVVLANVAHSYRTRRGPDLRLYIAEGVARCREDAETYRLDIGGVKFYLSPSAFAAFEDGKSYRLYYVEQPFVHMLRPVSAEAWR